jgi:hypothetical protein
MSFRSVSLILALVAGLALGAPAQAQTTNLRALHDALHLTPDEEPAWNDYQAVASPSAQAQQRRHSAAQLFPGLTAPRRIDLVEAEMQQDLADLHRQGEALKRFYARLSPAQQRTFDAQTLPPPPSRDDED